MWRVRFFLVPLLALAAAVALAALGAPLWVVVVVGTVVLGAYALLEGLATARGWGKPPPPDATLFGMPVADPLRGIGWSRRRAIVRAVRRGEAVADPRDAQLAVAYAAHLRKATSASASGRARWIERAGLIGVVLPLALALARSEGIPWWSLAAAVPLLVLALGGGVLRRRVSARVRRAEEENRRLLGHVA